MGGAPPFARPPSGHVYCREGVRNGVWYAKYRLPDGRQVHRKIGPAWRLRGRPPAGYVTKRTAEAWLRDLLDEARRGTLPGLVRTDVTFREAADEWLRYVEVDRQRKPATVATYRALVRARLKPVFGDMAIEAITTPMLGAWIGDVPLGNASRIKLLPSRRA